MARLNGLPSEHHHEGPGDAPRRGKRARPTKSSMREDSASVGKRTASPTVETPQNKRVKRVQIDDDSDGEEQLANELAQSVSRSQHGDVLFDTTTTTTSTTTLTTTPIAQPHRVRRHSEPVVIVQSDNEDEDDKDELASAPQPLPGLTPHLDRLGAARGRFASRRRERMSMPAQLHVERIDDADLESQRFQYAPLTAVLDSRVRRRLRRSHLSQEVIDIEDHQRKEKKMLLELRRELRARDDKIRDLEYRLEAQRMGDIDMSDDQKDELELQLEQARREIDELRASDAYMNTDRDLTTFDGPMDLSDDESEELVLVDPEELHISQDLDMEYTPNGKYASRVLELSKEVTLEKLPSLSQLTHDTLFEDDEAVPNRILDKAVERYERELQHYTRMLAESQGALRVITIELQNLHFVDPGASSNEILLGLRHSFDTLRSQVEKYFPGTTNDLNNSELLQKVPQLFSGIFYELREKVELATASQKTEVLLRRQYEGVLDLLGEAEERKQELEKKIYTLDKSNEAKSRTIVDLEERVETLTALTEEQEAELQDKEARVSGLEGETEDKESALARLREAVETYRADLDNVTLTAAQFQTEHHELIDRMEKEHADVVRDLEAQIGAEQEGREAAEDDAQQKSEYIDELESRIEKMEGDVDAITNELKELGERVEEEKEARAAAETERDEQADVIYGNANTIENLNETIADLTEKLAEAKENLETERAQRETTEAALDEANEKIEDLEARIHDSGIQANELRSKLFQLQQEKEQTVVELQEDAEDREHELAEQLAAQSELREGAQITVASLEKQIAALQDDLDSVEADLAKMTIARDELEQSRERQVTALATQIATLEADMAALEESTSLTIDSLQTNVADLTAQVARQQSEIKRLAERLVENEQTHQIEKDTLNATIETLESDLATARSENEEYRKENESLSGRVGREALELLNITNAHADEVSALKTVIATHEDTIKQLQDSAKARAAEYEETLEDRMAEIEELRLLTDTRVETIALLEAQIEDLKKRFAAREEDTRVTIDALTLAHRQLLEQNETLAEAIKKRNADALKAVQEMKIRGVEIKTKGVDLHRVATGKIGRISEKVKVGKKDGKRKIAKRQWDSGFGVDDSVEDEEASAADDVRERRLVAA
jgi:DNA repair exonuclease SbcCD ATPase subunit